MDSNVRLLDIAIAYDFVTHNNDIMDVVGRVDDVQDCGEDDLVAAIEGMENGNLRELFNSDHDIELKTVSLIPALSTLTRGSDFTPGFRIVPVHHSESGTVCGGGFDDPRTPSPVRLTGSFPSEDQAASYLASSGYHIVSIYATHHHPRDHAITVSNYGCDDGEFRDQAIVTNRGGGAWGFSTQKSDPNPEVLAYWWPAYWWGSYVIWWHHTY